MLKTSRLSQWQQKTWKSIAISFCGFFALSAAIRGVWPKIAMGQQNASQATHTLKVQTEVVNVYAVVRDRKGRLIPDLNKDDFALTEDGAPQTIRYFSRSADTPLDLGIMVDTSPSQQRVLQVEQDQAKVFLNHVLQPKDLAFVLHFDVEVELLQDFTASLKRLSQAIDDTQINGGGAGPLPGTFPGANSGATHLYDAVYLASHDLMMNEVGRKVLILLTDGQDQGSKIRMQDSLDMAQKADVIIYAVDIVDRGFYGPLNMSFHGDEVLRKYSSETGGQVIKVNRASDTGSAFEEIANQLRTQYLLGYTPSNKTNDGGFRRIRVTVNGGNYKIQARRGYFAPTS